MTSEIDIALYERSWSLWGAQSQYAMLAEECCELAKAALKRSRIVNGSSEMQLIEEIADVEIMIDQVKHCAQLSLDDIDTTKMRKMNRLANILYKSEHKEL